MNIDTQVMIGEETLKAQGAFSVLQTDYSLTIASVAGVSLKVKDELKCGHFITGRRAR